MQVINMVETKEFTRTIRDKDKYSYRGDRPFKILQRLCFFFLEKLNCNSSSQQDYVKTYKVHDMPLMEKIFHQEDEIFRRTNFEPSIVYIGRDDYMEMMKTEIPRQYMDMKTSARIVTHGYEKIKGMNLIIVPWMKGVLVAPPVKS